ncbi:serine/threonine-protein kinase [Conexibacter sp. CPCC 206217]|uniref:serine/threonine-protein kinase n=1 Tax=Conexibacter sp. CPCC 206217 TaxID=3064574 RepID=UPI00271E66ED|nr:serine/threonine-protein kinase [Conexibacter sp. CPCC 206217]MDO8211446.1 serine/threonine-protein kinase [Conexibacter sp. CPCC 206217]
MSGTDAPTARLPGHGAQQLVLDRYRLLHQLGAGAFGVVWLAHDERLARDVAVKAIALDHASGRAEQEARAAARLAHPAIVTLYEAGSEDGVTYLVTELVRGGTLADLLRAGALSDRDVALIGISLCQALAHAHAQGVVHRDVKPSNVLIPDATYAGGGVGSGFYCKLTDFGVARIVEGEGGEALTRTGDVVGTLAYMAPEQAEGREAGAPADLYAAALVLYEALSGVNPVRAGTAVATARRLGATLPSLARQRNDLPPELCEAIDRALLPRPRERGTVAHLHRALTAALPQLGDEPGTVEAPHVERFATAVTQVAERGRRGWRRRSREQELAEVAAELGAAPGVWTVHDRRADPVVSGRWHRHGAAPFDPLAPQADPVRRPSPFVRGHVLPGVAGGVVVALAVGLAPLARGVAVPNPLLAGLVAALAIGLLPRIGWLASAFLLLTWLAGPGGVPGIALIGACGVVAIPLLLPFGGKGRGWSVPFAAPLLGAAMLSGAYPAIAGQARTVWRRAALGALGFWLLALAEPLARTTLFYGRARGTQPLPRWDDSLSGAFEHGLRPLLQSGALATALLWAAGAAVLPWLVRGRHAAVDLVAGIVWAAALAAGAGAIGASMKGTVPSPDPRGAALGAAVAVLVAVAARAVRQVQARRRCADDFERPVDGPAAAPRPLP